MSPEFQEAAKSAGQPSSDDLESFFGSEYGQMLDEACQYVFTKRSSWTDAAVYVLGAPIIFACCALVLSTCRNISNSALCLACTLHSPELLTRL